MKPWDDITFALPDPTELEGGVLQGCRFHRGLHIADLIWIFIRVTWQSIIVREGKFIKERICLVIAQCPCRFC